MNKITVEPDNKAQQCTNSCSLRIVGIELPSFSDILRDIATATNLCCKNGAKLPNPLYSSLCHSETEWDNAMYMYD